MTSSSSSSSALKKILQYFWLLTIAIRFDFANGTLLYPRGGSFGYLAAVAMPLDLPNRNVYVAFNFEANYGLPSNDSYNEWIDRWDLDKYFLGIGNNVTTINGRDSSSDGGGSDTPTASHSRRRRRKRSAWYTRSSFYRTFIEYLNHFHMNGSACLLRTICEVSESRVHEHNGLLGSIFKILFTPTSSAAEQEIDNVLPEIYDAEDRGERESDCSEYTRWCPHGVLDMISEFY